MLHYEKVNLFSLLEFTKDCNTKATNSITPMYSENVTLNNTRTTTDLIHCNDQNLEFLKNKN